MLPTVPVSPIHLEDYAEAAGEESIARLREAARPLQGARVLHLNSTAFGGGVSELLMTQIAMLTDLGIESTWQLVNGTDDFFAVTKDVHNGLQGADVEWTPAMQQTYLDRVRANAEDLISEEPFDYYFIHDPQPCAILPILEESGTRPEGTWIWRCHIDTSSPNPAVWEFFVPFINRYDAAIFTMKDYVGPGIAGPQLAIIPPTIDPLSMKNAYLDPDTASAVLRHYGIDRRRPILTQVSRFDPWKDPSGVIDVYRLVKKDFPELQLALVGSMAHDDPEGWAFLNATREHAEGDPDVHLLTNLDHVGNLEVNAFQRSATVVLQKSIREGFGLTVSEAMWKKKPVIGGDVGGIRLQIENGKNGYLVDSIAMCAERVSQLVSDPAERYRLGNAAVEHVRENFLSLREVEDYCRLMTSVEAGRSSGTSTGTRAETPAAEPTKT